MLSTICKTGLCTFGGCSILSFFLVPSSYEVSDLPGTVPKAEVNLGVKLVKFGANIKLSFSLFRFISFNVQNVFPEGLYMYHISHAGLASTEDRSGCHIQWNRSCRW